MKKEILTPEELKRENVLDTDRHESERLQRFIKSAKKWADGEKVKSLDLEEDFRLTKKMLSESIKHLGSHEQGLLHELTNDFSTSFTIIVNDKQQIYSRSKLLSILTRKLCYLLKLPGGKKQAEDLIRSYRAMNLMISARGQLAD